MHGLGHRASLSFDTHTHQMPGQKYKGVWRSIGKEGVFDFTEYEDVGLSEQVEEHGFDHEAFGEKAFERKKEALHTAMQAQTRARDASAVKGSEASIESMMALVQQLQIGSSSSSASKDKPSATTDARSTSPVKADDGDSTSSDSSSEEAQAGPSAGLAMLAPAAKKAKAAAAATNKSGPNTKSQAIATAASKAKEVTSAPGKPGKTPTPPTPKTSAKVAQSKGNAALLDAAAAPSSAPEKSSATGILQLDGRANRTLSLDSKYRGLIPRQFSLGFKLRVSEFRV